MTRKEKTGGRKLSDRDENERERGGGGGGGGGGEGGATRKLSAWDRGWGRGGEFFKKKKKKGQLI